MANEEKHYGWGLIGPGRFAEEFVEELSRLDRVTLTAVASRSSEKAAAFAERFGFQTPYHSYEALVKDPQIDIVYIAVPHAFHREVAELALNAGKAVLCEKPLTAALEDTQALIQLAREKGAFLMEALKTAFLPVVGQAKQWIDSGRIGVPKLATAHFCFSGPGDPDDRLMNPALGGGAVLDVGIYPIHLTHRLLGRIQRIDATGILSPTGVEESVSMIAQHQSGASSAMTCSFNSAESMDASILGTEGEVRLPKFHTGAEALLVKDGEIIDSVRDTSGGMVSAEIRGVMEALDRGLTESPHHPLDDSLYLAELMTSVIEQVKGQGPTKQLNS
ncbi:MAG: Gfo/Idh/MocA family oxidoreductase [Verrucomicrobiota bacterium]